MLSEKSIIKLCKRATKRNPKSVHIFDTQGGKTRYLETNRGVFMVENVWRDEWDICKVPFVGY